jgi:hypothetical protein
MIPLCLSSSKYDFMMYVAVLVHDLKCRFQSFLQSFNNLSNYLDRSQNDM